MVRPTPPDSFTDGRRLGLNAARIARQERAEILATVRTGERTFRDVLTLARERNPVAANTRLDVLLLAVPGIGRKRVQQILEQTGLPGESRLKQVVGTDQEKTVCDILAVLVPFVASPGADQQTTDRDDHDTSRAVTT